MLLNPLSPNFQNMFKISSEIKSAFLDCSHPLNLLIALGGFLQYRVKTLSLGLHHTMESGIVSFIRYKLVSELVFLPLALKVTLLLATKCEKLFQKFRPEVALIES